MPEQLQKLRPDRDLQCYFQRPSAAAVLSETSASGFTVSGCWRQQMDWAVVEWTRDNVFEHPALRPLPDGDLSGIRLNYQEERTNCIALDSTLYPTVDWPYLRIWAVANGIETQYRVPLKNYGTPVAGAYLPATAAFTLQGSPSAGDYVELAWLSEHYNYQVAPGDTLAMAAAALADIISRNSTTVAASASGNRITLTYNSSAGGNANRIGAYGTVHGAGTESWEPGAALFSAGQSPTRWRIDLDFGSLRDVNNVPVPTTNVRKMRWTWAADLQAGNFTRSEFAVAVSNWSVSGDRAGYSVAGPGSRRIEDDSTDIRYQGTWTEARGNYSGGSIRCTTAVGASFTCTYQQAQAHQLYLGTRRAEGAGQITVRIDGGAAQQYNLQLAGEDVLVRIKLADVGAGGTHTVLVTHAGPGGACVYFDFLEIAFPCAAPPSFSSSADTTLATDWDTDHSIAIAPERTAWLIRSLGFTGRANHYAGALWFYELTRPGHQYATATIRFSGSPEWSKTTRVVLGPTAVDHLNLIGDTAESVTKCFELLINAGSTGVWASASGAVLTITSRTMGSAGNGLAVQAVTNSDTFSAQTSSPALAGGSDGTWVTDLAATPRLNRAARDWSRSYFRAMAGYGIDAAAAFSMELQHGDASPAAGIAQLYPNGDPAWLNTPALQTNFSPASTAFWKQVYADMAKVMNEAGMRPYLQFGEVQWWYFPNVSGMPFYDAYTTASFQSQYGRPMRVIPNANASPAAYPEEIEHLPRLVGEFTDAVIAYVRATYPTARFEVLYPPDVNNTDLNRCCNLPTTYWTPQVMDCLKTENFTYTGNRNLDLARDSILLPMQLGFPRNRSSHLVGIGEYTTPWVREQQLAQGEGVESVVLFALDQFCLIGYTLPLDTGLRRAGLQGSS